MTAIQTENGVLYDFGRLTYGRLTIKNLGGSALKFYYGPFKDFTIFEVKGSENKEEFCSEGLVTLRYLKVCGNKLSPSNLNVKLNCYERSLSEKSAFSCSDEMINSVYKVSEQTLKLCVFPHNYGNSTFHLQYKENQEFAKSWRGKKDNYVIIDGSRRDREVWCGDLYPELRNIYLLFNDKDVIHNTFDVILSRMSPTGHIPASSISNQIFYEYNAWFVVVLLDYVFLSGDDEYIADKKEVLQKIVDYLMAILDKDGVLNLSLMQTWAWTASRTGQLTSSNCVLYKALKEYSEFVNNHGCDGTKYAEAAQRVKDFINLHCLDKEKMIYSDVADDFTRYALDASSLAVLFDVAPESYRRQILKSIKDNFVTEFGGFEFVPKEKANGINWVHNDHIWPFVNLFYLEALFKEGMTAEGYEFTDCVWGNMLKNGAETFWEVVDGNSGGFMADRMFQADDDRDTWNSECHGWSAGHAYLFYTYFAGLQPMEKGYRKINFKPDLSMLDFIDCKLSTPLGLVEVTLKKSDGTNVLGGDDFQAELSAEVAAVKNIEKSEDKIFARLIVPEKIELYYKGERLISGEYELEK